MRLTLQEMVSGAIAEATEREKLAQAEGEPTPPEKEGGPPTGAPAKKTCPKCEKAEGECTCEKEKESAGYKCASASTELVEKVASAVEFIGGNIDLINWEKVAVGEGLKPQAANAPEPMVGVDKGETAMDTNLGSPTAGMQSTDTGQASKNQPESAGSKDDVGNKDGQTNKETAMLTDMAHVPGGTGEQPQLHQEGNLPVLKKASVNRVRAIWNQVKQAADAENPAQIKAGPEPLENPDASAAEEQVPKLPGPAQAQANLVQTKDPTKPADVTKQQAKAEPKRQMGEVISEPAQKKSTDPVLHANLDAASSAGVKLSSVKAAAARSYLRKIAQAGEAEDATPEEKEKAKKLKEALAKKEKEKESQFGGGAMPPPAAPTPAAPPPVM